MSSTSRKLRVLVDSTSAKAGAKEVTSSMGKVTASGKQAITTFKDLNTVLGQSATQFSKLKQMQKSYNPFATLEKSIQSYTAQMTKAMNQGQTFTVKLKEGNTEITKSLKNTEAQTKKTTNQFIKLKDVTEQPFSKVSTQITALTKAISKLNNTMFAEEARTKALNTELGKSSVKVQEQRRLTEELMRSKVRLNSTYSDEYVQLIRTRKAIEDRNKTIRAMDTNITKSRKSVNNLTSSFSMLGTVMAGVSIYFSTAGLVRQADAYTNLTNKLSAVTQGMADTAKESRNLLQMSIENRSSLEGTMDVYTKMIRVNEGLGKSQQEVVSLTEAVSKAVAMSGATAQGAQGAIMQFGQAMASNFATSAQELNSILEQTPALAYYMVKGLNEVDKSLNLTTGTLKKFAEEGGLSTELMFEAFQKVLPHIRKGFESTSQTVESATKNLSDSFSVLIGEMDGSYGISEYLVGSMKELAQTLPDMQRELTILTAGVTTLVSGIALGGLVAILSTISPLILAATAGLATLSAITTSLYLDFTKFSRSAEVTNKDLKELTESADKFNATLLGLSSASLEGVYSGLSEEISNVNDQLNQYMTTLEASKKAESMHNRRVYVNSDQFMTEGEREFSTEEVERLDKILEALNSRLAKTKSALDSTYSKNALKGLHDMTALTKEFEADTQGLGSEYKTYLKDLNNIDNQYKKSATAINKLNDSKQKGLLITQLMTEEDKAQAIALEKYTLKAGSVYNELMAKKAETNPDLQASLDYQEEMKDLAALYDAEKRIIDVKLQKGVISSTEHNSEIKRLGELRDELAGIFDEEKKASSDPLAGLFDSLSQSISEGILQGDWTSLGDALGTKIGDSVGSALSESLGSTLGGISGSLAGAAAGYVISGILAGSTTEQTGSSANISLSGSNVNGYSQQDFKKSSFLGSSSFSEISEYNDGALAGISLSVSDAQRSVVNLVEGMGSALVVSVNDFTASVSEEDLSGAVDSISESFLNANVAYIEDFQRVNQTALEALSELSKTVSSVQDSFKVTSDDSLLTSVQTYVNKQANVLKTYYSKTLPDQLRSQQAALTAEIKDIQKGSYTSTTGKVYSSYEKYGKDDQYERLTRQAEERIEELRVTFFDLARSITESLSRVSSAVSQATAAFSTAVTKELSSIYGVAASEVPDLLSALVQNYEETFYSEVEQTQRSLDSARAQLEGFSDLGIDSDIGISEFRTAFEEFTESGAFNPTTYARWLAASAAVTELNDAVAETANVFSDVTDYVRELLGLTITGAGSLDLAQAQYQEQLTLAKTGDDDAINSLTEYADAFLEAAEKETTSSSQYNSILAQVISSMSGLLSGAGVDIPQYATGGNHEGGWRVVGDGGNGSGSELEYTGASQIFNGKQASSLIDVDGMVQELSEIRMILRSGMGSISRNTNKSYKVLNRWDNVGLPKERDF